MGDEKRTRTGVDTRTQVHSEVAIHRAQAREDARAEAAGERPRLIRLMADIRDPIPHTAEMMATLVAGGWYTHDALASLVGWLVERGALSGRAEDMFLMDDVRDLLIRPCAYVDERRWQLSGRPWAVGRRFSFVLADVEAAEDRLARMRVAHGRAGARHLGACTEAGCDATPERCTSCRRIRADERREIESLEDRLGIERVAADDAGSPEEG